MCRFDTPDSPGSRRQRRQPERPGAGERIVRRSRLTRLVDIGPPWSPGDGRVEPRPTFRLRAWVARRSAGLLARRLDRRRYRRPRAWREVRGVITPVGKSVDQGGPGAAIPAREARDLIGHGAGWPISRVETHQLHRSATSASSSRRSSPNASRPPARTARPRETACRGGPGRGGRRGSWATRPPAGDDGHARRRRAVRDAAAEGSAHEEGEGGAGHANRGDLRPEPSKPSRAPPNPVGEYSQPELPRMGARRQAPAATSALRCSTTARVWVTVSLPPSQVFPVPGPPPTRGMRVVGRRAFPESGDEGRAAPSWPPTDRITLCGVHARLRRQKICGRYVLEGSVRWARAAGNSATGALLPRRRGGRSVRRPGSASAGMFG